MQKYINNFHFLWKSVPCKQGLMELQYYWISEDGFTLWGMDFVNEP